MGALASRGRSNIETRFINQIRRLTWYLGARNHEGFQQILEKCLMPSGSTLQLCNALWVEVEQQDPSVT